MKHIIHVNKHTIAKNNKYGTCEPTTMKASKHYKEFFKLDSLDEDDYLNIDWAEAYAAEQNKELKRLVVDTTNQRNEYFEQLQDAKNGEAAFRQRSDDAIQALEETQQQLQEARQRVQKLEKGLTYLKEHATDFAAEIIEELTTN